MAEKAVSFRPIGRVRERLAAVQNAGLDVSAFINEALDSEEVGDKLQKLIMDHEDKLAELLQSLRKSHLAKSGTKARG